MLLCGSSPQTAEGQNPKCSGERRPELSNMAIIIQWTNFSPGNTTDEIIVEQTRAIE